MRIAIIGTGKVGGALAGAFAGRGHAVTLGAREPSSGGVVALAAETGSAIADPRSAAQGSDLVFLAVPWPEAERAVTALGDLSGRIVVDFTNPLVLVDGRLLLAVGHSVSGGERIAGWLPGERVV